MYNRIGYLETRFNKQDFFIQESTAKNGETRRFDYIVKVTGDEADSRIYENELSNQLRERCAQYRNQYDECPDIRLFTAFRAVQRNDKSMGYEALVLWNLLEQELYDLLDTYGEQRSRVAGLILTDHEITKYIARFPQLYRYAAQKKDDVLTKIAKTVDLSLPGHAAVISELAETSPEFIKQVSVHALNIDKADNELLEKLARAFPVTNGITGENAELLKLYYDHADDTAKLNICNAVLEKKLFDIADNTLNITGAPVSLLNQLSTKANAGLMSILKRKGDLTDEDLYRVINSSPQFLPELVSCIPELDILAPEIADTVDRCMDKNLFAALVNARPELTAPLLAKYSTKLDYVTVNRYYDSLVLVIPELLLFAQYPEFRTSSTMEKLYAADRTQDCTNINGQVLYFCEAFRRRNDGQVIRTLFTQYRDSAREVLDRFVCTGWCDHCSAIAKSIYDAGLAFDPGCWALLNSSIKVRLIMVLSTDIPAWKDAHKNDFAELCRIEDNGGNMLIRALLVILKTVYCDNEYEKQILINNHTTGISEDDAHTLIIRYLVDFLNSGKGKLSPPPELYGVLRKCYAYGHRNYPTNETASAKIFRENLCCGNIWHTYDGEKLMYCTTESKRCSLMDNALSTSYSVSEHYAQMTLTDLIHNTGFEPDFSDIGLSRDPDPLAKNNIWLYETKICAFLNVAQKYKEVLKCSHCGEYMVSNFKYAKKVDAALTATVFSCPNEGNGGEHDVNVYFNRCYHCGWHGRMENMIDSRKCRHQVNGFYLCMHCGGGDGNTLPGTVCPSCGFDLSRVQYDKKRKTCPNCSYIIFTP